MADVKPLKDGVCEVKIADVPLRLKTSHSADHLRRLAEFVDDKIGDIQKNHPNASFQNTLILACLTIAEETLAEKMLFKESLSELKANTLEIISEIEASPIHQRDLES
tara:strand:+ start:81456 stop:81779 length:324 start_codon:yes stop_codon:yes gene_type:complete